jgi:hypothetical protein
MPPVYYRPPNALNNAGPGIGITDPAPHQASVANALISIRQIAVGNNLLVAIDNLLVGGMFCSIAPWDPQATNKCATPGAGGSDNAKTTLAQTLEFNHAGAHTAITNSLAGAGQAGNYGWLATQICNHPIPNIVGVPAVAASHTVHGANWVTQQMVQDWATNNVQFPGPLVGQQVDDAALIMVAVLRPGLIAGPGAHSRVHWSATSVSYTNTAGVLQPRPPFLGLAHELVHALHNLRGGQTGHDIGSYSRVLYEYLCIGLADWAGEPISENAIRLSAGIALRNLY